MNDDTQIIWFCSICHQNHRASDCPYIGLCLYCKEREATLHFGDMLSFTHGGVKNCCELCCAQMQLDHARERAAEIPKLEARVAELEKI